MFCRARPTFATTAGAGRSFAVLASAGRQPSIAFRHGARPPAAGAPAAARGGDAGAWAAALEAAHPSKPGAVPASRLPAFFGRPYPLSAAEAFAIDTGGCEYVPPPPPAAKGDKKGGKPAAA